MTTFDTSKSTFGTFEDRAVWLIRQLLADFSKWGPLDAYACAGNLGRESNIQMVQEGGQVPPNGGWGLAQWTGPRRVAFSDYCTRSGRSPTAMTTGYAYLFVELKGEFASVIDKVAAAATLEAKVAAFEQSYEMAGVVALSDRIAFAVRAQKAWEARGSLPAPAPPVLAPQPTPAPAPAPKPAPTPVPAPQGPSPMPTFSISSLISLIGSAPSIIEGVMKLITEVESGYAKGKAAGGDPIVIFEDILAALVANKGAVASAVLGPEPTVTAAGAKVAVK